MCTENLMYKSIFQFVSLTYSRKLLLMQCISETLNESESWRVTYVKTQNIKSLENDTASNCNTLTQARLWSLKKEREWWSFLTLLIIKYFVKLWKNIETFYVVFLFTCNWRQRYLCLELMWHNWLCKSRLRLKFYFHFWHIYAYRSDGH